MRERPRVVIPHTLPAAGLELLRERFSRAAVDRTTDEVAGAAAIVADPTVPVTAELLDRAGPSLRVVANFAVGYDNIDVDACRERGVIVTNTPDVLTNATAELAVALMLAAARRIGEAERMVRRGDWKRLGARAAAGPGASAARRWASSGWGASARAWRSCCGDSSRGCCTARGTIARVWSGASCRTWWPSPTS